MNLLIHSVFFFLILFIFLGFHFGTEMLCFSNVGFTKWHIKRMPLSVSKSQKPPWLLLSFYSEARYALRWLYAESFAIACACGHPYTLHAGVSVMQGGEFGRGEH